MRDAFVPSQKEAGEQGSSRIVLFPGRRKDGRARHDRPAQKDAGSEIADLRRYEQDSGPDDYPRRMMANALAFVFILALTVAGVWLAEQMALLRKTQDCAFVGRKNCAEATAPVRSH
jgi:hypothetical protein